MTKWFFWEATAVYYFSLSMAVAFTDPVFTTITGLLFFLIPSTTETELIPGLRQSLNTNIEILKTQRHLAQKGYYNENVQ